MGKKTGEDKALGMMVKLKKSYKEAAQEGEKGIQQWVLDARAKLNKIKKLFPGKTTADIVRFIGCPQELIINGNGKNNNGGKNVADLGTITSAYKEAKSQLKRLVALRSWRKQYGKELLEMIKGGETFTGLSNKIGCSQNILASAIYDAGGMSSLPLFAQNIITRDQKKGKKLTTPAPTNLSVPPTQPSSLDFLDTVIKAGRLGQYAAEGIKFLLAQINSLVSDVDGYKKKIAELESSLSTEKTNQLKIAELERKIQQMEAEYRAYKIEVQIQDPCTDAAATQAINSLNRHLSGHGESSLNGGGIKQA